MKCNNEAFMSIKVKKNVIPRLEDKKTKKTQSELDYGKLCSEVKKIMLKGKDPEDHKSIIFSKLAKNKTWSSKTDHYRNHQWKNVLSEISKELSDPLQRIRALFYQRDPARIYHTAQHLLEQHHIITHPDTKEIYIYKSGVYEPKGDIFIQKWIQTNFGDLVTNHVINELLSTIRRESYPQNNSFEEPTDKICLQNGILDLNSLELSPHTPNTMFLSQISIKYDSQAVCPTIDKFFQDTLITQQKIDLIHEMAGYCLLKSYPFDKGFILLGEGCNGKSTVIRLLTRFLGDHNTSSQSLQALQSDRNATSDLYGKHANMFSDLDKQDLKHTGIIKSLIGGDMITAQKKFKDSYQFKNYAKLIFSCNRLPQTLDHSMGFFRRWIIIEFDQCFLGKEDSQLIHKISTEKELSGFLNKALKALQRVLSTKSFSNSSDIDMVKNLWFENSDSVSSFIANQVIKESDRVIEKSTLYADYQDYCHVKNIPVKECASFHKTFQSFIRVEAYKKSVYNSHTKKSFRVNCWKGITTKAQVERDSEGETLFVEQEAVI